MTAWQVTGCFSVRRCIGLRSFSIGLLRVYGLKPLTAFLPTFRRNRRNQHNPWSPFAAVVLLLGVNDPGIEVALEWLQSRWAFEGFVETEEGDDHIGLIKGEVFIRCAEAIGARAKRYFIGGPGEIAHHQIELRETLVQ